MLLRTNDQPCPADDPADDHEVRHRVSSLFAVVAILIAAGFLYASTVPLVFAVPEYRARLTGFFTSFPTESGRAFDWTMNILALIPLGFFWSGTLSIRVGPPSSKLRAFIWVARDCLALAALAETLQIWLPVRVPSLRDLVALECGACVGCGLWWLVGTKTTNLCCRIWCRFSIGHRERMPGLPWLGLFGLLMCGCLAINTWANPAQFFQMYRHRTFSPAGPGAQTAWHAGNTLLVSVSTALALCGLCGLALRALERGNIRPADALRIFVATADPASDLAVAVRPAANEKTAEAALDRAA